MVNKVNQELAALKVKFDQLEARLDIAQKAKVQAEKQNGELRKASTRTESEIRIMKLQLADEKRRLALLRAWQQWR